MIASVAGGAPSASSAPAALSSDVDVPVLNPAPEGVPAARAKAMPKAGARSDSVWVPRNGGKKYHRVGNCAHRVDEVTVTEARARGYAAIRHAKFASQGRSQRLRPCNPNIREFS